jgi:putative flavoprotein involved in K+ transport
MHAADYRNPGALPPGAVLVVGSAQSGCQIAEDLLGAGRRVFLSVSAVARVPRRYRGRDIVDWMIDTGFWDVRLQDLEDPRMRFAAQPQVSGVGLLGRTVSLQHLARNGAILVGRLAEVDGATLRFVDNVAACVQFADERSAFFKRMIDKYIERNGLSAAPPDPDPADRPDDGSSAAHAPSPVDLCAERISTVVWCTGFTGLFAWVRVPVLDANGRPMHERGVSNVPGVYFLGAPWLYKRKSGVLYGMSEDAEFIAQHIAKRELAWRGRH